MLFTVMLRRVEENVSTNGRVLQVVSDVLAVPVENLSGSSSPDTIASWDSLNHMNLVLALEEEFGIQFTDDQIMQLLTVEAMINAVAAMTPATDVAG